jgi:hypothetical protein
MPKAFAYQKLNIYGIFYTDHLRKPSSNFIYTLLRMKFVEDYECATNLLWFHQIFSEESQKNADYEKNTFSGRLIKQYGFPAKLTHV